MRTLYLALLVSPTGLLVLLAFASSDRARATISPNLAALAVLLVGAAGVVVSNRIASRSRPLPESELRKAWRSEFFERFVTADVAPVGAFVMFFLAGSQLWIYTIGMAIALVGLIRMAPTRANIDDWDARHRAPGDARPSLGALLTASTAGPA